MAVIKEIKKIEPLVKEIKPVKKENLEEELTEDELENFQAFISGTRRARDPTLAQDGGVQERERAQVDVSKEDIREVNFKQTYNGTTQVYGAQKYNPVSSPEGSELQNRAPRVVGANSGGIEQQRMDNQMQNGGGMGEERRNEYVGKQESMDARKRRI